MSDDTRSALTRSFAKENRSHLVRYFDRVAPRRFRRIPLERQAVHLKAIFPWIHTPGWRRAVAANPLNRREMNTPATDGVFLLPHSEVVLYGGRKYHSSVPSYNAFLDIVLERMRAVLPRVDIHLDSCDPNHIMGKQRTLDALWHHENLFAGHDVCPIITQLGRMYAGMAPEDAMQQFATAPVLEFGGEPARAGIILTMHYLEHDYFPNMEVECPGAAIDFLSRGTTYEDCPRWHAKGQYLALDWNFFGRARPEHGSASMFTAYPKPGSNR